MRVRRSSVARSTRAAIARTISGQREGVERHEVALAEIAPVLDEPLDGALDRGAREIERAVVPEARPEEGRRSPADRARRSPVSPMRAATGASATAARPRASGASESRSGSTYGSAAPPRRSRARAPASAAPRVRRRPRAVRRLARAIARPRVGVDEARQVEELRPARLLDRRSPASPGAAPAGGIGAGASVVTRGRGTGSSPGASGSPRGRGAGRSGASGRARIARRGAEGGSVAGTRLA